MINILTETQLTALLARIMVANPKLHALCSLMAYCGLRISEALSLKTADVVFHGQIVTSIGIRSAKNNRLPFRTLPIPEYCRSALDLYIHRYSLFNPNSLLLFPGKGVRSVTPRSVQLSVRSFAQDVLGRRVSPHTFRHTYATMLARKAPIRVVQELLGHSDIRSTQIYTHVTQDDFSSAVRATFGP